MLEAEIRAALRAHPDFPAKGILFQDIAPLLRDPALVARCVDAMAAPFAGGIDKVAGVESRGFLFGLPIAQRLGVGFVPVRKAGKLPGATLREEYALEYGTAVVEVQADAFARGDRVLLVDDVLATGGTANAALRVIERTGARVEAFAFLLEIGALHGRRALARDAHALCSV